jgi:hypothetical protein
LDVVQLSEHDTTERTHTREYYIQRVGGAFVRFKRARIVLGELLLKAAFYVMDAVPPQDTSLGEPEPEDVDDEPDYNMAVPYVTMTDHAKEMVEAGARRIPRQPKPQAVPLKGSLQEKYMRERGLLK